MRTREEGSAPVRQPRHPVLPVLPVRASGDGRVRAAPRVLLLDFDGVVCDTERAARRSWAELYARSGARLPDEVWHRMVGTATGVALARADLGSRRGAPVGAGELEWRQARKAELADREPLRPGVAELIGRAGELGVPVAVVSSGGRSWVRGHLDRLGLLGRLAFTVTGEEADARKPAPDLYLLALRRAGVPARSALAVEDSPTGVRAARAAGVTCVAVPTADGAPVTECGADVVITSLRMLGLDPPSDLETA